MNLNRYNAWYRGDCIQVEAVDADSAMGIAALKFHAHGKIGSKVAVYCIERNITNRGGKLLKLKE